MEHMQKFSLLYPQNITPSEKILTNEAINDLSVDYICEKLTGERFEQNVIKNITIIQFAKDFIMHKKPLLIKQ